MSAPTVRGEPPFRLSGAKRSRSPLIAFAALAALVVAGSTPVFAGEVELAALMKGPLTPLSIKDVIHEHRSDIRACSDGRPKDRQPVNGKVVVHFLIGMDGGVSDVRIASSTVNEAKLEQCMVAAAKRWRFPKPKHTRVEVNFPFLVGPSKKPAPGREPLEDRAPDESEPDVLK